MKRLLTFVPLFFLCFAPLVMAQGMAVEETSHYVLFYPQGYHQETDEHGVRYFDKYIDKNEPSLSFFVEEVGQDGVDNAYCRESVELFLDYIYFFSDFEDIDEDYLRDIKHVDKGGYYGCGVSIVVFYYGDEYVYDQMFYYIPGQTVLYDISALYHIASTEGSVLRAAVDAFQVK